VCAKRREAGIIHNLCECGGPLLVRYDLAKARVTSHQARTACGAYGAVLPVQSEANIVSLGEGMTPLIRTPRLGKRSGPLICG